jgi:hypothetical protein
VSLASCGLRNSLAVMLATASLTGGCGDGDGKAKDGRVLAEGANLAQFDVQSSATKHRYRYMITKVAVFAAGALNFPPGCGEIHSPSNECIDIPDRWPAVVIWLKRPACEPWDCGSMLALSCLGDPSSVSGTYIWWAKDRVGRVRRHACVEYAYPSPDPDPAQRTAVMAFIPHVQASPAHFSLVVDGMKVPLHLS